MQFKPIAQNRRARHDYHLEERLEAGLVLEGWEAKSLRAGRVQLQDGHVLIRRGEAFLIGARIDPLPTVSGPADPARTRKLLLHRRELARLDGSVARRGYTLVPLSLYWSKGRAKLQVALARGRKAHDRRAAIREREWQRERRRLLKRR